MLPKQALYNLTSAQLAELKTLEGLRRSDQSVGNFQGQVDARALTLSQCPLSLCFGVVSVVAPVASSHSE